MWDIIEHQQHETTYQIGPSIMAVLHFSCVWQSHDKCLYGLPKINVKYSAIN